MIFRPYFWKCRKELPMKTPALKIYRERPIAGCG